MFVLFSNLESVAALSLAIEAQDDRRGCLSLTCLSGCLSFL